MMLKENKQIFTCLDLAFLYSRLDSLVNTTFQEFLCLRISKMDYLFISQQTKNLRFLIRILRRERWSSILRSRKGEISRLNISSHPIHQNEVTVILQLLEWYCQTAIFEICVKRSNFCSSLGWFEPTTKVANVFTASISPRHQVDPVCFGDNLTLEYL